MELKLIRYSCEKEDTLGLLFINGKFVAYTLEDEFRTQKVYGETRVPAGKYKITLREGGGFHQRYLKKFPGMHKGMLWIREVPNFEYILIHIGNKDDDTAGCILVGDTAQQNITEEGFIGSSTSAYKRIYPIIAEALEKEEEVTIEIVNDLI